ncbi:type II secretion system secretin GspD [Caldimonas brevitalea]|uniref:General secretion pathway protein D n=1 Tax=Caldimonas brevitalea TaxID=413882 RepID=A0A0G3BQR0_9BURK|nr:type II secretion system secretin GspD [Caldimonas brevitalea]AKJ29731.1 general secretion pathway protein D [Caldimonas brevitalea]
MTDHTNAPRWAFCLLLSCLLGACSTPPPPAKRPPPAWKAIPPPTTPPVGAAQHEVAIDPTAPQRRTDYLDALPALPEGGPTAAAPASRRGETYELNFQDADLRGVIDAVLGEMLKVDYVIAPTVQGRITLKTARPVGRASLLPALEAALASVSVAIVKTDQAYQVLPLEEAPRRVRGAQRMTSGTPSTPGFAVEIVPLRYVNANEMKGLLETFVPKGSVLQADANLGHVVIAGSSQDRAAIARTVETFDVDWMRGMTFAVYRLEQARPETLVAELRTIFQGPQDLFTHRIRLVPLERTRSVLGMARNKADLELLEQWIARLDVSNGGDRKIFVYNVQNGNAKELVASLRQVLTGEQGAPETTGASAKSGTVTTASGANSLSAPPGSPLSAQAGGGDLARLVAIEENNSLLFHGTDQEYRVIREALRQIDVLPRQVMIEAILAEVTLNDSLRYGVQWFFDSGENTVTLSAAGGGAVASQFPGFSYVYSGRADARVVLNALQAKTEVRILSAPKISVLNNQKASLQVGDQVPIITQTSQSTGAPGAPVVSSVEMRDTGVILEVTPRVNDNGNVILDVMQEVSEVAQTTSSGIDSPTIQRRKIHSVVATRDGFTVALGGLIRENGARGTGGVPVLKDLPVLGHAFKNTTVDSRRTELVVLLVPHVMRNQAETQAVVDALIDGFDAAGRLADHAAPLLPQPPK